jgi:DNA modification methylase
MSAQEWGSLMNVMRECGYHWSSTIIWAKNSLIVSRKDYHTQYEPIWYGWLEGAARLFSLIDSGDRKQSDLWEIDRPTKSPLHPTTKPIELAGRAINNSSQKDDVVLDLFGGSGTTLIASEQTGRVCHMMELDPKYADCIVKRYILQMDNNDADVFLLRDGEKIHWIDVPQPQPQQNDEPIQNEEDSSDE